MSRELATINQTNLWGKTADSAGLEPQRNDLYFVNFNLARNGVAAATDLKLAVILPQYVRSVSIPEIRTKAEPIRRDSVAYNMPSWDDPIDAVKITFLLDTHDQDDRSDVIQFLDAWLALTRAGRGRRGPLGYSAPLGYINLNSQFRIDFRYDVSLYLLRGSEASSAGFVDTGMDEEFTVRLDAAYRILRKYDGLIQQGLPSPPGVSGPPPIPVQENLFYQEQLKPFPNMVIHSIYTLSNAWLSAYKISDFSYAESALTTVDATFYVDSFDLSTVFHLDPDNFDPSAIILQGGPDNGRFGQNDGILA